jgi:hypothetical protein
MTSDSRDEVKFRELIAKRLEEIADQNEKDGSHDAPFPAWIAGIRDAAGFVKYERFTKDEIAEQWPTAKDKLIIEMSQRICTCGHRGHEHHAEGYSCERCICPEFYLMHLAKGPYDDLTPVSVPEIQPVEVACILNAVSSNGIVHLDCEIKDRPLEESLEIQIRLSEFESVYRYIVGGLDDEGEGGNPIIRPMTGFDVWDIMRSKQICHFCKHPRSEHREMGDAERRMPCGHEDIDPEDESAVPCLCYGFTTSKEESEALAKNGPQYCKCGHGRGYHEDGECYHQEAIGLHAAYTHYERCKCKGGFVMEELEVSPSCAKCGHTEAMHVNDGLGCMDVSKDAEPDIDAFPRCHCPKFVTMGEQSEKLYDASDLAKSRDDLAERFKLYREATKAEQSEQAKSKFCIHCGHYLFCHYGERNPNGCTCSDFTTVSQFSSCSQSVQPEHSSQSQEPQLPDRFQDKSQRVRIAGVRLVRRENTLKSDLPVRLDLERALSYLSWLAQLTSLVTECQACRKLAVPGLNNLLLELKNSHPTHMEHPNSASPTE